MCVLVVADKRRPTDEEMSKMASTNGDGAGIAWREGDIVKWEKGLSLEEVAPLALNVPMPFVLHFRIASCGGKTKEMTHPFPLEKDIGLALSGQTKGFVLFHNGHWMTWREKGLDGAIRNKLKVPDGKWSDTRTMTWLAYLHGHSVLEFIDEKVILFGPNKIEIFHPDGWFRVDDLLVSNRIWEHHYTTYPRGRNGNQNEEEWGYEGGGYVPSVCRMVACQSPSVGATWYCTAHQPTCRFFKCQKPRIVGSENCADHQSMCVEPSCNNPRVFGEQKCIIHTLHNKAVVLAPDGGVAPPPVPFRHGLALVHQGHDQQGDVGNSQDRKGAVGNGTAEETAGDGKTVLVPAILTNPVLQEQSKWARSINTKALWAAKDPLGPIM